jgi:uncharacterized protein involved in exopolysaccharide biosynthesis
VCNEAFLERRILDPFLEKINNIQRAINTRKYDCDALAFVADEVENTMAESTNSSIKEEDTKLIRLEQQTTQFSTQIHDITKDLENLKRQEKELNENIFKLDRTFDSKRSHLAQWYSKL